jgi:hypothetical protein
MSVYRTQVELFTICIVSFTNVQANPPSHTSTTITNKFISNNIDTGEITFSKACTQAIGLTHLSINTNANVNANTSSDTFTISTSFVTCDGNAISDACATKRYNRSNAPFIRTDDIHTNSSTGRGTNDKANCSLDSNRCSGCRNSTSSIHIEYTNDQFVYKLSRTDAYSDSIQYHSSVIFYYSMDHMTDQSIINTRNF